MLFSIKPRVGGHMIQDVALTVEQTAGDRAYKVELYLYICRDILLLEAGALCILVAPLRYQVQSRRRPLPPSPSDSVSFWLVRWLLFRLMFASGVVKLTSGCPTCSEPPILLSRALKVRLSHEVKVRLCHEVKVRLCHEVKVRLGHEVKVRLGPEVNVVPTALSVHFESQCLPTPLAWYAHHLPEWFLKLCTAHASIMEVGLPILFFFPNRFVRYTGFFLQVSH
uniref:Lipase maturation factor n=1 Tax=Timema douglasi TaxID=61478 RepID=A0A7R8VSG2_TIMDO|nr:unnamed protein product [Timema douglasi]